MWPVETVMLHGSVCHESHGYVMGASELKGGDFVAWAGENCSVARLEEGDALWIPYGFHVASLALVGVVESEDTDATTMIVPYLSATMASQCESFPDIADDLSRVAAFQLQAKDEVWTAFGQDLINWLDGQTRQPDGQTPLPLMGCGPTEVQEKQRRLKRSISNEQNKHVQLALDDLRGVDGQPAAKKPRVKREPLASPEAPAHQLRDAGGHGQGSQETLASEGTAIESTPGAVVQVARDGLIDPTPAALARPEDEVVNDSLASRGDEGTGVVAPTDLAEHEGEGESDGDMNDDAPPKPEGDPGQLEHGVQADDTADGS